MRRYRHRYHEQYHNIYVFCVRISKYYISSKTKSGSIISNKAVIIPKISFLPFTFIQFNPLSFIKFLVHTSGRNLCTTVETRLFIPYFYTKFTDRSHFNCSILWKFVWCQQIFSEHLDAFLRSQTSRRLTTSIAL